MTENKLKRFFQVLFLIAAGLVCLAAKAQQVAKPKPSPPPGIERDKSDDQYEVLEIDTRVVNVPVSVLDREGRFVADLLKPEFKIYEDDVEQEIAFFAPVESFFTVVLLIDVSPSTRERQKEIKAAALSFIDVLRPDDNVMVVSFNENIRVLNSATKDRQSLRKAIERLSWNDSGTFLYGTVDALMNRVFRRLQGRKALVMLTDGEDTDARRWIAELQRKAPKNVTYSMPGPTCEQLPCASFEGNLKDAEELDALIYPIRFAHEVPKDAPQRNPPKGRNTSNPGRTIPPHVVAETYLRAVAEKSGGRYYSSEKNEDLATVFHAIANELRHQYSLGYYVKTQLNSGERRRLKVEVARPNLSVRAKASYVVSRRRIKAIPQR